MTSSSSSSRFFLPCQVISWRESSRNTPYARDEARTPPPENAATRKRLSELSASGGARLMRRYPPAGSDCFNGALRVGRTYSQLENATRVTSSAEATRQYRTVMPVLRGLKRPHCTWVPPGGLRLELSQLGVLCSRRRRSCPSMTKKMTMARHKVVSQKQWLSARKALLVKEKKFTKSRDQLSRERRQLPWVKVEKDYVFEGPNGKETLSDLFEGRSQLIVYHFMFGPDWEAGCKHCSFWADNFNPIIVHLNHRDVTMVAISRAPYAKLAAYKKRMGWNFKWVSSGGTDFNFDYHASFTPEEKAKKKAFFNYKIQDPDSSDREGASVFYKDPEGNVFHTYSTYARGIDMVNAAYHYLDLVPKGRDEGDEGPSWLRRHDEYGD